MALENLEQVVAAIKAQDIEALAALDPKALSEIAKDTGLLRAAVGSEHVGEEAVNKELASVRDLVKTVWFWAYTSQESKKPVPVDQIRKSLETRPTLAEDPLATTYGIC